MFRWFLFFILIFNIAYGDIVVDKKEVNDFTIEYLYDETKALQIEDIVKKEFPLKIKNQFAFSYLKGNSWFKFTIHNNTKDENLVLHMVEPFFEGFDLYEYKDGRWNEKQSDLFTNLDKRDIYDITPAFILDIQENSTKTFYIKAYTKFAQFGEFKIYTQKESLTKYRLITNTLYVFFFGSLFIMIVFNTFLFVTLKEAIYFYYVNYIIFYSGFIVGFSGLTIYLGLAKFHYLIHLIFIPMTMIFLILFSIKFLDVKKNLPITYKVLLVLVFINVCMLILSYIHFEQWYPRLTILASITYIVLLYMAIRSWIIGHTQAKYYLFAMSIYIFSIIVMSLMINGILENNYITRYAFLFGSFIEIVVFSLLLAHRFYDIQNEKIRIQNELLEMRDKNKTFLEQEIDNRTKKIKGLLKEKEFLLKEVYHRVKNNFQLIVSILVFEKNKYKTLAQKEEFSILINRIKSMSMIHQSLYDMENISTINSDEYITKIVEDVKRIYQDKNVDITEDIVALDIDADHAIPLGIIINEVLTNAIKHNNKTQQQVTLTFKEINREKKLLIKDNGDGFSFDDIKDKESLGIKLVEQFIKKLPKASYSYDCANGCLFTLTFQ